MDNSKITIETTVDAPVQKVWDSYNKPEHVVNWNFADSSWECSWAESDLKIGGEFKSRMQAKDGSAGFDFGGVYTEVKDLEQVSYVMEDGRKVDIYFQDLGGEATQVTIDFDPENENPEEMQRGGWQSILDNFKKYTESLN